MADEVKRVRNLETGLEHTVPAGHWSLEDERYEVVKSKRKRTRKSKAKKSSQTSDEEE